MGLLDSIFNLFATDSTNATNVAIANANNRHQMRIAEANNDLQRQLNEQNNAFASAEAAKTRAFDWDKMLYQNEYNSPFAQIQRYREAGLNPSVMMNGQTAVASSQPASSATAAPHGSGITPSMPIFATPSLSAPQFSGLSPLEALKTLKEIGNIEADTKKKSSETRSIDSVRDLIVEQLEGQIENQNMQNEVFSVFGMLNASIENQRLISEVLVNSNKAYELATQGKLNEAQEEWNKWKNRTEQALSRKTGYEADLALKSLQNWDTKFQQELRESQARASANNAQANLSNAQAKTEDALREARKGVLSADKREREKAVDKIQAELDVIYKSPEYNFTPEEQYKIRQILVKLREQQLSEAEFNNSFVGRWIHSMLVGATNGAGAGSAAVALKAALK